MKKRLLMISTFLLSFIILITNVNAAQELTCAYGDGGWTQKPVKLVQDKDGTLFKYTASHGTYLGITETKWEKFDVKISFSGQFFRDSRGFLIQTSSKSLRI